MLFNGVQILLQKYDFSGVDYNIALSEGNVYNRRTGFTFLFST